MDFDTLSPRRLDEFDYAITTRAAYQSTPPPNFKPVVANPVATCSGGAPGRRPPLQVHRQGRHPGPRARLRQRRRVARLSRRAGTATVIPEPVIASAPGAWSRGSPVRRPGDARRQSLDLGPGRWRLSLQYHSQVPLTVSAARVEASTCRRRSTACTSPTRAQGAFWPAGEAARPRRRPDDGHGRRAARPEPAPARSRSRAAGLAGDAGRHPAGRRGRCRCTTPAGATSTTSPSMAGRERESLAANLIRR